MDKLADILPIAFINLYYTESAQPLWRLSVNNSNPQIFLQIPQHFRKFAPLKSISYKEIVILSHIDSFYERRSII